MYTICNTFEIDNPFKRDISVCDPYLTQDGYDSGQVMICNKHQTETRPMYDGGLYRGEYPLSQSYDVTLSEFKKMVKAHRKEFGK